MSVTTNVYYSSLAADPDLAELVDLFVAELPERLAALHSALETSRIADVARFAHQLKGAGGSYGFPQLTPVAARLEMLAKQSAPETLLCDALNDLVAVAGRVRSGCSS